MVFLGGLSRRPGGIGEIVVARVRESEQPHAVAVEAVDCREVGADRPRVQETLDHGDLAGLVKSNDVGGADRERRLIGVIFEKHTDRRQLGVGFGAGRGDSLRGPGAVPNRDGHRDCANASPLQLVEIRVGGVARREQVFGRGRQQHVRVRVDRQDVLMNRSRSGIQV